MQLIPVTCLGFLEFIGTTELLVVLFVALLVFGPRKLPELGRSLGQALNQVRAASDDFKRTWEYEVELDSRKPALDTGTAATPRDPGADGAAEVSAAEGAGDAESFGADTQPEMWGTPIARGAGDVYADGDERAGEAPKRAGGDDEINAS